MCAAGSKELYDQAQPLLDAMGKESYYLGEVLLLPGCLSSFAGTPSEHHHSLGSRRLSTPARIFCERVAQVGAGAKAKIVINMVMGGPCPSRFCMPAHRSIFHRIHVSALVKPGCVAHAKVHATPAGMMMASFSEGLKLAAEVGVDQSTLLEAIGISAIAAPMYKLKARCPRAMRQLPRSC